MALGLIDTNSVQVTNSVGREWTQEEVKAVVDSSEKNAFGPRRDVHEMMLDVDEAKVDLSKGIAEDITPAEERVSQGVTTDVELMQTDMQKDSAEEENSVEDVSAGL